MAKCDYCGSSILFGGVKDGDYRFCNGQCHQNGAPLMVGNTLPQDLVDEQARNLHQGDCPACGGPGPVDVHTAHSVWSALFMTSWKSQPTICCQGCGNKARMKGMVSSLLLGWWGVPWGLIMTPVQVARNVGGLMSSPNPMEPSDRLKSLVRLGLGRAAGTGAARPPGPPRIN